MNGNGVPQDFGQAEEWFRLAAEQGHERARGYWELAHEKGKLAAKEPPQEDAFARCKPDGEEEAGQDAPLDAEYIGYLHKAAEAGDENAQYRLALLYVDGKGVSQDYKKAAKLFRKLADLGDAPSQFNRGVMYQEGYGVPPDSALAAQWYYIGLTYELGHGGIPRNYEQTYEWYRMSEEMGGRNAHLRIAILRMTKKIPGDADRAVEQGYDLAPRLLCARDGIGEDLGQDGGQELERLRQAVETGDAQARYELGALYALGRGIRTDQDEAAE